MWERSESPARHEDAHVLNEPSAATPVTDGENVYVFFRDFGVVSYDAAGAVRWKKPMGPFTNRMGAVASPIIAGSSLVLVLDQIRRVRDRRAVAGDGRGAVADRRGSETGRLDDAGPLRAAGTAGADRHGRRRPVRRPRGRERRPAVDPQGHGAGHGRQPGRHRRHRGGLRLRLRRDAAVRRGADEERQGRRRPALDRGVRHERVVDRHRQVLRQSRRVHRRERVARRPRRGRGAVEPGRRVAGSRTRTASSARASCGATRRASSPSCRRRWSSTGWSTRSRTAASSPCCAPTPARS